MTGIRRMKAIGIALCLTGCAACSPGQAGSTSTNTLVPTSPLDNSSSELLMTDPAGSSASPWTTEPYPLVTSTRRVDSPPTAMSAMGAPVVGTLFIDQIGCVRLRGERGDVSTPSWPQGSTLQSQGSRQVIIDANGTIMGTVGEHFGGWGGAVDSSNQSQRCLTDHRDDVVQIDVTTIADEVSSSH